MFSYHETEVRDEKHKFYEYVIVKMFLNLPEMFSTHQSRIKKQNKEKPHAPTS